MIIIQWVFFLLSSVLLISILRKSKLVFLPVFPFILGLLCGVDYMSSLFLFMNLSLMIVAVVKTIKNNHKPLPIFLFFIGLMIVLFMTLFFRENRGVAPVYLVPFWSLKGERIGHFINNILLFIPLGFSAGYLSKKFESVLYGCLLSISIEWIQLLFVIGECDIDDVIGNCLGMFFGVLIYWKIVKQKK